ncbi:MAG TPA: tRNA (cytidine(34)-2'-O)-methyltransferase [Acidimicrobiia bacterium]|nr:tRNA (cytidine(34)-2'-O)-methyltransferase [Acidimicrobiia bacterium]
MFHVVLYQPEIPPNTGNAMRLSANTGSTLHLIEPLGFEMDDARLRRAGMDYRDRATVHRHPDLDSWFETVRPTRTFALAKIGAVRYDHVGFVPGDAFVFGPESVGLRDDILSDNRLEAVLTIPMRPGLRSLNLSNSVAVVVYEAWRQNAFGGAENIE